MDTTYYENKIINSLAVTDPRMNTGIGTPIRKIISAVSAELADYDSQRVSTTSLYSLNAVSGVELDYLVGMFGFARQTATAARGEITLKRDNPDSFMQIPAGTSFYKPATSTTSEVVFQTTRYAELGEGVLSATIPIVCTVSGLAGNVAANTIIAGNDYNQYVSITNQAPTVGGNNRESDDELRQRFIMTVFRNEAGTADQILGLAYANENVTRAIVVGQEARYSETCIVSHNNPPQTVQGVTDVEYYALVSNDRVAAVVRQMYTGNNRIWVRNAETGNIINYGNFTPLYDDGLLYGIKFGGTELVDVVVPTSTSYTVQLSQYPVLQGTVSASTLDGTAVTSSTAYDANGVATVTLTVSQTIVDNQDNVAINYQKCVASMGDMVTVEFDYLSKLNRGESQDVDVYIDGLTYASASDIQYADSDKSITDTSAWVCEDGSTPIADSWYLIMAKQPVLSVASTISTGASILLEKDTHYKLAYDTSVYAGSRQAQDIIMLIGTPAVDDNNNPIYNMANGIVLHQGQPVYVSYSYNNDVWTAQNLIGSQTPVTMDVLVHSAKRVYVVLNIDMMYTYYQRDSIKQNAIDNIKAWAADLPFGAVIQFSDIETVGANTSGVDNIRVTSVQVVNPNTGNPIGEPYEIDFPLNPNEVLEIYNVNVTDKVQQNWG